MNTFAPTEVEIVGFNGTMLVECSRSLLAARHKPTDRFFKLSLTQHPRAFFTNKEIDAFDQTGRLTLLPKAISAESLPGFPKVMAIYVKAPLLNAIESDLPESFLEEPLAWQKISDDAWATCASVDAIEKLMNSWGKSLVEKADDSLVDFFATKCQSHCKRAEELAKLARKAGCKSELRYRIYLRSGVALLFSKTPERLMNLYDFVFRHEFKETTWEHFLESLRKLGDVLQTRATVLRNSNSNKADGKVPVAAPAVTESTKKH